MACAECPHCGLYVCHLHVPACGEFLWHEPECEDLLSESEDYAVACAQCMEEASTAAKQKTVLCFRLCFPSSLDMRILTAVMSFLCVPCGFYKVQNRRYLLQALLMGHVYTCNDLLYLRHAKKSSRFTCRVLHPLRHAKSIPRDAPQRPMWALCPARHMLNISRGVAPL